MLKVFASLVIGFYIVLWVTGNNPQSLRQELAHWADGSPGGQGDWSN